MAALCQAEDKISAGPELVGGAERPRRISPSEGAPDMPPVFAKGPLVLFGDSTTALRGKTTTYGELLAESFKNQQWPIQILNAGVPGDTSAMARKRFNADVLEKAPSLVVIQFGINDSAVDVWKNPPSSEPRVAMRDYRANLEFFVDEIKSRGAEVVLMTPNPLRWTPMLKNFYGKPPYLPGEDDGLNVLLKEYAETVREIAREKEVPLIDVEEAYAKLPEGEADRLLSDGMHPNNKGHMLVQRLLLERWIRPLAGKMQP